MDDERVPKEIVEFFKNRPPMEIPEPTVREAGALEASMGIIRVVKTLNLEEYLIDWRTKGNLLQIAERINLSGATVSCSFITPWGKVGSCALLDDDELEETACNAITCNLFHQRVVLRSSSEGIEDEQSSRMRAALLRAYLIQDEEKAEETPLLPETLAGFLFDKSPVVLSILAEYCDTAQILEALGERPIPSVQEIVSHRLEHEFETLDHDSKPLDFQNIWKQ